MRTALLVLCASLYGCEPDASVDVAMAPMAAESAPRTAALQALPLRPLPDMLRVDPARAALGGKLFEYRELSADGSVSCASCHPLDRAGADGLMHSRGANGREMPVNTPTVYNVSFNFRFNWSGAYGSLEDEFDAPITLTMATSWPAIEAKLRANPELDGAFAAAYRDGVTTANIKDALARYIETLITPNSRFDQYLRGDPDALTLEERRGLDMFLGLGCASCHQGANIGGNLFQRLGVMHDYFEGRQRRGGAASTMADLGRFESTQRAEDRHVFRVPSLRNVALTSPYFHDGTVATLEQAVAEMGYVQLGRRLSGEQISLVVAFLKTLTGLPTPKKALPL